MQSWNSSEAAGANVTPTPDSILHRGDPEAGIAADASTRLLIARSRDGQGPNVAPHTPCCALAVRRRPEFQISAFPDFASVHQLPRQTSSLPV
jgi:hypothetical protein